MHFYYLVGEAGSAVYNQHTIGASEVSDCTEISLESEILVEDQMCVIGATLEKQQV